MKHRQRLTLHRKSRHTRNNKRKDFWEHLKLSMVFSQTWQRTKTVRLCTPDVDWLSLFFIYPEPMRKSLDPTHNQHIQSCTENELRGQLYDIQSTGLWPSLPIHGQLFLAQKGKRTLDSGMGKKGKKNQYRSSICIVTVCTTNGFFF